MRGETMARQIVLRGTQALREEDSAFERAPLDVVIEGERIASLG